MPSQLSSDVRRAEVLSSRENRWLKKFRAALKGTPDDAVIGVEGVHLVQEALRSGLAIDAVLVSAAGERHLAKLTPRLTRAVQLLRTSDRLFESVTGTETPQGIAALVRPKTFAFDDLLSGGAPLVVVMIGVQDPGNVGTIVRSAEAFGATGAVATRGTAQPFSPKALRGSAGSALRLPIVSGIAPAILLTQLRVAGLQIYAASSSANADAHLPSAVDLKLPCALLIGNEGAGLPAEIERSADQLVRIPLAAPVESLNAAVAAAVLLYEAARQRNAVWKKEDLRS
jgi:RNA methyltransferase, TrmH family